MCFMKRNVLIVDDKEINRKILAKVLEDDYNIITADNGRTALDVLGSDENNISAILLDLIMPVMDGYEFLKIIKNDPLYAPIPVVVTTVRNSTETELEALRLGASDFILKPYIPSVIKCRVQNLISLRETAMFATVVEKDMLTGIYNKEAFYEKASYMMRSNPDAHYTIIAADIEKFNLINEVFGMAQGDVILMFIAGLLGEAAESFNGFCARINADNFVVLVPGDGETAKSFIVPLLPRIKAYDSDVALIVRFGIYPVEDMSIPANIMCDRARLAAKSLKKQFGSYYAFYDDTLRSKMMEEQEITLYMQTALDENQFTVYFQPKCSLKSGRVVGAEALVRWNHPQKGFLAPATFIPIFEKNGFVTTLDVFVIEFVCRWMRGWLDSGNEFVPVSVNLSRIDVLNPRFPGVIMKIIEKYHLSTEHLRLEITESAYTSQSQQLIKNVTELKNMGFKVEMDDFGTGYSSLSMLDELPIDTLKLDWSFLKDKNNGVDKRNFIAYIISMAKWLKLEVVAEGVETKEQATFLRNSGCDCAQGYYFAKPLPSADFEKYLKKSMSVDDEKELFDFEPIVSQEDIWNPLSHYNSYFASGICPLVIVDAADDRIKPIKYNDKFISELSLDSDSVYDENVDFTDFIPENARADVVNAIKKAIRQPSEFEIIADDGENGGKIRVYGKMLRKDTERALFLCSINRC